MEVQTDSPDKTRQIAQDLAKKLFGGAVIALFGTLGSGKTVFVQGLARALGIKRRIISPTFIFLRSYPFRMGRKKLIFHHVDLYRTQDLTDYESLGFSELFSPQAIVVLEWADKIKPFLPKKRIDVFFEVIDEKNRRVKIVRRG